MAEYQGIDKIRNLINTFWLFMYFTHSFSLIWYCVHIFCYKTRISKTDLSVHVHVKAKKKQIKSMPSMNKFRNFLMLTQNDSIRICCWSDQHRCIFVCIHLCAWVCTHQFDHANVHTNFTNGNDFRCQFLEQIQSTPSF